MVSTARTVETVYDTGFGPVRYRRPEFFYITIDNEQGSAGRASSSSADVSSSPTLKRTTGDR